jgi:hypothetical protein
MTAWVRSAVSRSGSPGPEYRRSAQRDIDVARRDVESAQHTGDDTGLGTAEGEQDVALVDALVAAVHGDLQVRFRANGGVLVGIDPVSGRSDRRVLCGRGWTRTSRQR